MWVNLEDGATEFADRVNVARVERKEDKDGLQRR